jgi:hypothetical protein
MATATPEARLRIEPGDAAFVDAVLRDLALIARTPAGRALFGAVSDAGRVVTIRKPPPLDPPNAWTEAADRRAATARGQPTGEADAKGAPALGTGVGSDCTVRLNPADWPNPAQTNPVASDVQLYDLLCQAASLATGRDEPMRGDARSAEIGQAVARYAREREAAMQENVA